MVLTQSQHALSVAAPKICKSVGNKAACCKAVASGKGLCLGLGLGLGIWGPIAVVGVGIVGGYYYWKKANEMFD
ncbi:MAG: hypothetical protein WCP20_01320 [Desulfuromonadales bacterium]